MCSKWSYFIFKPNIIFLLPIVIKGDKSMIVQTQTLINLGASTCFIDKRLVRQHSLALVEKTTLVVVEMTDG
jgi:hypothetical protein